MSRLLFLIKTIPAALWFAMSCTLGMIVNLILWRNPSNGSRFGRILGWGGQPLLGIRSRLVDGQRLYDAQPCVYVANHQSDIDLFVYGRMYPTRTVTTGKKEVLWIPFFGLMFYAMGNILLDRSRSGSAIEAMNRTAERIRRKRVSVWVFPEGHRNPKRPMLPFKKGAFHLAIAAQVPVVPIVMSRLDAVVDVKRMRAPGGVVEVRVLEPISTVGMGAGDAEALCALAREHMEEGLALTDHVLLASDGRRDSPTSPLNAPPGTG